MDALSAPALADAATDVVRTLAAAREAEQAVSGIDTLTERDLQDALERGLIASGLTVQREVRYPVHRRRNKRSEGFRCDFVVGEPGDDAPWWLELKLVAQHTERGPNRAYRSKLLRDARDDVVKLACDPEVPRRAMLLLLHTASAETGDHDVTAFAHACADEGLPVEVPRVRHVALIDRLGNRDCAIAVVPVGGL